MSKRILDVTVAAVGLMILAPCLLLVWVLVRLSLGSPAIFRQVRPGLNGEPFTILKFRTMRHPLAPGRELLDEEDRLTRVGSFLRSSSLDELPELVNVLRGDMSLVGPRPLLVEYLDRYSPEQARRHDVRPGMTGLAQIHGRNALDWSTRLALDTQYVDERSMTLDLQILGKTLREVARRRGVSAPGHATCPVFMGTEQSGAAAEGAGQPSDRHLGSSA